MSIRRSVPKNSRHSSGQARVRIDGRVIYLGKFGSKRSRERYAKLIADWLASKQGDASPDLTIDHLAIAYLEHAQQYYVKNGEPTGHLHCVRSALRYLVADYGTELASRYSARKLKQFRKRMISDGLSRKYINDLIAVVKRCMRWAASEELVVAEVAAGLQTVDGLRVGRSEARELPPVEPVEEAAIVAVLPLVSKQIGARILLQKFTGMRPSEVLSIGPRDITIRTDGVWAYRPERHKTEHRGRDRVVVIGPKGQEVLRPWLDRDRDVYCFQPKESDRRHRNRRGPGERYRRDSYRTAIQRACKKAGIESWSPCRIRHAYATFCRQNFGLEAAQRALGHAHADVTQHGKQQEPGQAADDPR